MIFKVRVHPLSRYKNFSEKLKFLTPRYTHVRVRIRGLEMLVLRKILRVYLMDGPLMISLQIKVSLKNLNKISFYTMKFKVPWQFP